MLLIQLIFSIMLLIGLITGIAASFMLLFEGATETYEIAIVGIGVYLFGLTVIKIMDSLKKNG